MGGLLQRVMADQDTKEERMEAMLFGERTTAKIQNGKEVPVMVYQGRVFFMNKELS